MEREEGTGEVINGRYRVKSRLGAGAMGTVDLAVDLARENSLVALKRVEKAAGPQAPEGEAPEALIREFETLARLHHPNLPAVHDFGRIEGSDGIFISMEYVKGRDLTAAAGVLDAVSTIDVVAQVCRALEFIHTRGLCHRDLKPENILVTSEGPAPRAFLVDFGLASRAREEALLRGTLHFVAPEILKGEPADGRADLYALGVILYRLATGRCPFEGSPRDVLKGHLETSPESPAGIPPGAGASPLRPILNEALASVILKLLEKEPSRRYRSAAETLRAINRATGAAHPIETPETGESYSAWAPLVGREKELAAAEAALTRARPRGGKGAERGARLLLVSGEAGSGRTRFLLELKRRAQVRGTHSSMTACVAEAPAFQPIAETIRLLGAAPVGLFADTAAPEVSPGAAQLRLTDAAAASLAARASTVPAAIILDDAHLADEGTLAVCESLARNAHGPTDLLVALAYRTEEVEETPLAAALPRLRRLAGVEEIALEPLGAGETGALLKGMLGLADLPQRLVDLVHGETSGNPFFVEQAVRSLLEDGTISRVDTRFRADVDTLTTISFPTGAGEAIRRRLARLSAEEHRVLEALSVIARPAGLPILLQATGLPEETAREALTALRERRIVEELAAEAGPLHRIPSARARECVYEGIDYGERRTLHGAVAGALKAASERGESVRYEELARHFINGADPAVALGYALEAADRSRRLGSAGDAIGFLRRALELLPPGAAAERADVHFRIGLVEKAAGRDAQAMESLEQSMRAAGVASRRDLAARARVERASLHVRRGRSQEAIREIEQAQELLADGGEPALVIRTYSILAAALGRAGKMDRALEMQKRALEHAERAGEPAILAPALNNLGMILCVTGRQAEGFEALERAIEIRSRLGDRQGEMETTSNLGLLLAGAGAFDRALRYLEQSQALARTLGDLRAVAEAGTNLGATRAAAGRHDLAGEAFEEAVAVSRRIGDDLRASHALDGWGAALRIAGDIEAAVERHAQALEYARRAEDAAQECYALGSLAIDHATAGGIDEARDALRRAERVPSSGVPPRARIRLAEASSLVRLASGDPKGAEGAARSMLEAARAEKIQAEEARALLLLGLALEAQDDGAGAIAALEPCVEIAGGARAGEVRWSALAALSRLAGKSGDRVKSAERLAEAAAAVQDLAGRIGEEEARRRYLAVPARASLLAAAASAARAADPLQPAEGGALAAIYRMSQIITSAEDLDDLLARVLDLALEIVRAERGLIILVDEEGRRQEVRAARGVEPETIADALEYSRNVVRDTAAGEAVVTLDAESDRRFNRYESVGLFHIKSLACVPMKVRDRVLGTVYLDSRRRGYLFRDEDVAFLRAFANLAASAIEIARLNARLSSENVTLRREVQDLRKAAARRTRYQSLIGKTVRMQAIYDLLDRVAASSLPVLITGESGTGKELVARALHFGGQRKDRKFFSENVAAIPDTLLESELFGHMRGAFTGAERDRKGVFELASGGTLFLDEIGDMSLSLQSKLLRALQEGEVRPIGGRDSVKVDVRVVSATNRDLETMVREGRFREDLYYRLNVVRIHIPPLRERKEDIPLLIDHFLERAAPSSGGTVKKLDIAALQLLLLYDWPGNVRELENEILKLAVLCPRDVITQGDIAENRDLFDKLTRIEKEREQFQKLDQVEKRQIERALAEAGGNRVKAADLLGISRATIYRKLREYGLSR